MRISTKGPLVIISNRPARPGTYRPGLHWWLHYSRGFHWQRVRK